MNQEKVRTGEYLIRLGTDVIWVGPIYEVRVKAGDKVNFHGYRWYEGSGSQQGGGFICEVWDVMSNHEINVWTRDESNAHLRLAASLCVRLCSTSSGRTNRDLYLTIEPLVYAHTGAHVV